MGAPSKTFFCLALASTTAIGVDDPKTSIFSAPYVNGAFESIDFVNSVVGWDTFFNAGFRGQSTVIGNIEGGHVWNGHEVFVRAPDATTGVSNFNSPAPGLTNELDYHATMVGHVLAGSGYIPLNGGTYTGVGLGMAPEASLVSGAIATAYSSTNVGGFATNEASTISVYRSFFQGSGVAQADVINSSWGGQDDPAIGAESLAIDALARQNASVALVVAAGNDGLGTVGYPASGFNNISVGSVGGVNYLQPSEFSSRGKVDFYNPVTGINHVGVRSAVDIAAPGEYMYLAAYLGDSGGIGAGLPSYVQEPSPTDLYFLNMDGTSFAAPMVAGGISLLKDAAKTDTNVNHLGNDDAFDTRVIKSVLMASATKTDGWNNGQNQMNVTTQSLDPVTGAGLMNLEKAIDVYYLGTRELALDGGGSISQNGWDAATIGIGQSFDYVFSSSFNQAVSLSVALNWFSVREFDNLTSTGSDLAFSNLDLEVWSVDGSGQFVSKIGESISTYNNTEMLRFDWLNAGRYGLRVSFDETVFDATGTVNSEYFGLAWSTTLVPEPGSSLLALSGSLMFVLRRRR
ncbi:MAG: hypothetical protein RLY69_562 [Verrucomicrobiota bacterium]